MFITLILGTSIVLQFAAAGLALYLIKVTGKRFAWILISSAIVLMGLRRSVTFYLMLRGEKPVPVEPAAEIIALIISVLILLGVIKIFPLFHSIKNSENELKKHRDQLIRYANDLKRSNEELQNFASIASHDLQEPLRKIMVFGDRLNRKAANLDDQSQDYIERMQKAASRMQVFIEDLLLFSRLTTKAMPFQPVNLNEIAQSVIGDLETRISETKVEVKVNDLPVVEAERFQITQLFQNILSNALKYQEKENAPRISIESVKTEDGNWQVLFKDNGIGFDEKYAERIFRPFERLHGRSAYGGTGMGLAICKKIVDRHNGTIAVTSKPNEGSTFIVTLPEKRTKV